MINLFDVNFMLILFDEKGRVPLDSARKPIVDRAQDRVEHLVDTISKQRAKIVIPTPALAEFLLISADKATDYLHALKRRSVFEVTGFDDPEVI